MKYNVLLMSSLMAVLLQPSAMAYRLSDLEMETMTVPTAAAEPIMLAQTVLPTPTILPSVIPPPLPIVKCLSDSETVKVPMFFRAKPTDKIEKVQGTKTTYRYLLENGGSIYSDTKIKAVRDVRPEIKKHPVGQRRFLWARAEATAWSPILAVGEGLVAVIALFARPGG